MSDNFASKKFEKNLLTSLYFHPYIFHILSLFWVIKNLMGVSLGLYKTSLYLKRQSWNNQTL